MSTTFQSAPPLSRVQDVVKRGWRRRLIVLIFDHAALALSIVFAGFTLLILLGTQILAWQWLLLLAAIGIGLTAYEVRRRLSDSYQVAQMMDSRLALHDSLSTAWFLHTQTAIDNPAAAHLLHHAEQLAETADPAQAFPFQRRRAWVITAALFVTAFVLFCARYFVTHDLSLEHTFLPLAVTQVFENIAHPGATPDEKGDDANARLDKTLPPGAQDKDATRAPQSPKAEQQAKQPSPDQAKGGDANQKGDPAASQDQQQAKNAEGKTSSDEKREGGKGDGKPNGSSPPSDAQEQKGDQQQGDKQPESTGPQKSSSMLDRMRDALSSVMAKIKPTGNNPQKSDNNNAQKSNEGQKSSDQAGNKDQSSDGQKDSGKDQSAQEQSSGEQSQQGAAKAQAAQGKDSAAPSDKKGSDAQSGVGHSDGDKQLREAEQAKAMGKLAEIIGKRSATLTGDMQVVPSGKQRLQTDYTHAQGQHADLGGEINRDEVPVEDQEYVREYMELVRKKPAPAAKPQPAPPNSPNP